MTAAVIVIYNPDIELLTRNINSIVNQVDKIIICDNGHSSDIENQFNKMVNEYSIELIDDMGNKGIAFALNRAVEYCSKHNVEWLLTLDQDSICPSGLIDEYKKYTGDRTGILSCAINYNNQELVIDSMSDTTELDECITSASYINVKLCVDLGGFDEHMFIDKVDFEYCYRVKKAGYKILRVNKVVLDHNLGDLKLKRIGNKVMRVGGHSSFRKFYIAQNTVYCQRKHPDIISKSVCNKILAKLIVKTLLYENNKFKKIKSILMGIKNGQRMKVIIDDWIVVK